MTVYIVITTSKCIGTDFPQSIDAVPFRHPDDAVAYQRGYLSLGDANVFRRTAQVVEREVT